MARTWGKTWSDWTPEQEAREFAELAEGHYLVNCLEKRTEADLDGLRASVDASVIYLGRPAGGKALDVGAGEGWATLRLRELGFDAIGVERSPAIAARAPEGIVEIGDAQDLPVSEASQDFVLCNSILEHVLNPDLVISELARVLAPGGVAVLTTTNHWHWVTGEIEIPLFPYMPRRMRDRLWRKSGRRHITPHYFTYRQLRRMAAEHGLECDTALDIKINDDPPTTAKGRIARVAYRLPGGKFALEAFVTVVKVRLRQPA